MKNCYKWNLKLLRNDRLKPPNERSEWMEERRHQTANIEYVHKNPGVKVAINFFLLIFVHTMPLTNNVWIFLFCVCETSLNVYLPFYYYYFSFNRLCALTITVVMIKSPSLLLIAILEQQQQIENVQEKSCNGTGAKNRGDMWKSVAGNIDKLCKLIVRRGKWERQKRDLVWLCNKQHVSRL